MISLRMHPNAVALKRYADGERGKGTAVTQHLETCTACRDTVAGFRELTSAVHSLSDPVPPRRILEVVLDERRAGERMILAAAPVGEAPPIRWPRYLSAAAAVLLCFAAVAQFTTRRIQPDEGSIGPGAARPYEWIASEAKPGELLRALAASTLLPPSVEAQGPTRPSAATVQLEVARIRPFSRVYDTRSSMDSAVWYTPGRASIRAQAVVWENRSAWRLVSVSSGQRTGFDTLIVSARDLRPLYRSFGNALLRVEQVLTDAHVTNRMIVPSPPPRGGVKRPPIDQSSIHPLPDSASKVVANADHLALILGAAVLDIGWTSEFRMIGVVRRPIKGEAELPSEAVAVRIVGEQTIRVLAGKFSCWVALVRIGDRRGYWWIDRASGALIRTATQVSADGIVAERKLRS